MQNTVSMQLVSVVCSVVRSHSDRRAIVMLMLDIAQQRWAMAHVVSGEDVLRVRNGIVSAADSHGLHADHLSRGFIHWVIYSTLASSNLQSFWHRFVEEMQQKGDVFYTVSGFNSNTWSVGEPGASAGTIIWAEPPPHQYFAHAVYEDNLWSTNVGLDEKLWTLNIRTGSVPW